MKNDRDKKKEEQRTSGQETTKQKEQHSSAFREPRDRDQKSTVNPEEANLEQERKEAMTERD